MAPAPAFPRVAHLAWRHLEPFGSEGDPHVPPTQGAQCHSRFASSRAHSAAHLATNSLAFTTHSPNLSFKPNAKTLHCFPYSQLAFWRRLNSNVRHPAEENHGYNLLSPTRTPVSPFSDAARLHLERDVHWRGQGRLHGLRGTRALCLAARRRVWLHACRPTRARPFTRSTQRALLTTRAPLAPLQPGARYWLARPHARTPARTSLFCGSLHFPSPRADR